MRVDPEFSLAEVLGNAIGDFVWFWPNLVIHMKRRLLGRRENYYRPAVIDVKAVEIHPVVEKLQKVQSPVNNQEMARLLGKSPSTATRLVADAEQKGLVVKERKANQVQLRLVS